MHNAVFLIKAWNSSIRKHHDLKHQIAGLRAEHDPEKRVKWLDEMEHHIKYYELQYRTGHEIVDTILTSKSLYCDAQGITLTCVVDGGVLRFLSAEDRCFRLTVLMPLSLQETSFGLLN